MNWPRHLHCCIIMPLIKLTDSPDWRVVHCGQSSGVELAACFIAFIKQLYTLHICWRHFVWLGLLHVVTLFLGNMHKYSCSLTLLTIVTDIFQAPFNNNVQTNSTFKQMSITMKSLIAVVQLSLDTLVGNNYNWQLHQLITITIKICSSEQQCSYSNRTTSKGA